jgi:hypothetical protein
MSEPLESEKLGRILNCFLRSSRKSPAEGKGRPAAGTSPIAALREQLAKETDPKKRLQLVHALRETRGEMFEIVLELPDLESVRKRMENSKDPREKAILANYARGLRENQNRKKKT